MADWLADTQAIALLTGRAPATVRSWAHRGLLARRGTGPRGRALYDVGEAERLAARLDGREPGPRQADGRYAQTGQP
jgi:hypothetical protein